MCAIRVCVQYVCVLFVRVPGRVDEGRGQCRWIVQQEKNHLGGGVCVYEVCLECI